MSLRSQFNSLDSSARAWRDIFQKLYGESEVMMKQNKFTFKAAVSDDNCDKNRYTNVLPYDQNRVILKTPGVDGGEYLNASPVDVPKARRKYILSQGPVEESVADFWQMIYENDIPAIIMLNRLCENHSVKCEKYYPCSEEKELKFDPFTIELVKESARDNFVVRELKVQFKNEAKTVIQVQYTEWPDFGVPESAGHFLEMLDFIKELDVLTKTEEDPPVVVHCSAGIGRSGTFVLVDSVMRLVELGVPEAEIDVHGMVIDLRSQRMGLIQTPEQLRFAWAAIVDGLENREAGEGADQALANGDAASIRKRKSESQSQEELNDRLTKRRELISKMVAKSRHCEETLHQNESPRLSRSVLFGGVVALASMAMYYYLRR